MFIAMFIKALHSSLDLKNSLLSLHSQTETLCEVRKCLETDLSILTEYFMKMKWRGISRWLA